MDLSTQTPASTATPTSSVSLAELQQLQFAWMARLSRMSGMTSVIVDSNMTIIHCDQAIVDILELQFDRDMIGTSFMDVVAELAERGDFGPGAPDVFCKLIMNELLRPVDDSETEPRGMQILTPSGRRLAFRQDLDHDGYLMLSCRDVTQSHIRKEALRVALDSSNSGYLIYDLASAEYRMHGKAVRETFGESMGERVLREGFKNVIHPDDYPKVDKAWREGLANAESWTATFRILSNQAETVWIRTQATPQISESGVVKSYIFFYTEVSSQLRVQDELRRAKEETEKLLRAKNAFLGRLSHEIRTPMNAVVGIADALIHHNGDPELLPSLELIQTSAEKIIRIVDESLEHTKLAEAKIELDPHAASPRESVENVCALWEQKAVKTGIDLRCRISDNVPPTMIFDSFRYEQCLNNLLSNAVKFAPAGRIDVVLTAVEKDGELKLVTAVKDTGIGMNETQLESLFEAYTQADKSISGRFGGTGLGMNITKQLTELMGGTVTVRSQIGEGTLIAITLPVAEERREADRRETSAGLVDKMLEDSTPPDSDYASLRVLVVDDNATNHMVVTSLLGSMVAHIDIAENGVEALQALENATYDVVLMDIHMPIMDGIEATLAIRGSQKPYTDVPIIALTADPQYQQKRLCKNIGMDDALAKPVKLTEVLGAFDRVLQPAAGSELAA